MQLVRMALQARGGILEQTAFKTWTMILSTYRIPFMTAWMTAAAMTADTVTATKMKADKMTAAMAVATAEGIQTMKNSKGVHTSLVTLPQQALSTALTMKDTAAAEMTAAASHMWNMTGLSQGHLTNQHMTNSVSSKLQPYAYKGLQYGLHLLM